MTHESATDDYERFTELFTRNEMALRAFARSLVPTWFDADEVVQEVALVAWRKFGEFEADDNTSFIKWVCVIARFKALHNRRSYARDRLAFCDDLIELMADEGVEENHQRQREYQALEACMKGLPAKQRRLITLAYTPGISVKEEAQRSGLRPNTVYMRLNRIRGTLFSCIQQRMATEGAL
jgi:RNA polymerase sigma-70 factor (ECF subfamily)